MLFMKTSLTIAPQETLLLKPGTDDCFTAEGLKSEKKSHRGWAFRQFSIEMENTSLKASCPVMAAYSDLRHVQWRHL